MTDWISLQAVAKDLQALRGARVDAVHLEARRVVVVLRAHGQVLPLALDTRQDLPSIYLLDRAPARDRSPGAILQLLRRSLEGARLEGAIVPFGERFLALCLAGRDRFGDERLVHLCGEFFGTHADIVLGAEGSVLFTLRARRRDIGDAFAIPGPKPPPARTLRRYSLPPGELLGRIARQDFAPVIEERDQRAHAAQPFALPTEGVLQSADGMLPALSAVARETLRSMELRDMRSVLRQRLETQRDRALRTLEKAQEEFAETRDLDALLRQGEALKLHLHELAPGLALARVADPQDPEARIEIPLDPDLSAAENMTRIFKRYQKLRSRASHLGQILADLSDRVAFLSDQLAAVEQAADLPSLQALRGDALMQEEGQAEQRKGPLRFTTAGGHEVLVGRSAKENDALTRGARPSDLWFHTKDRQGAHCILRPLPGRAVGAPDRLDAALLAAFYSKQRQSSHVPVDYTYVRHVRRPRGAAPGFVLYDHHETLFVTPDPAAIEAIRRRRGSSKS